MERGGANDSDGSELGVEVRIKVGERDLGNGCATELGLGGRFDH